jgi:maleylacetoacetate isomerase
MHSAVPLKLYEYFRSSASYRVRIGLNLKGHSYESIPIHLTRGGGAQFGAAFAAVNPQALVPVLETDEVRVSQSLAILEYLEEAYPDPPLLPRGMADRARVRELALAIACDIHPLNNLRVLKYLREVLSLDEERVRLWVQQWILNGFHGLEAMLAAAPRRGRYCFGDAPTLADCCLVPQMFNAWRFGMELDACPILRSIEAECQGIVAFQRAHPSLQPDAE